VVSEHVAVAQYTAIDRFMPAGHVIVVQSAFAEQHAEFGFSPATAPYFAGSLKPPIVHWMQDARHLYTSSSQQIASSIPATTQLAFAQ
jgi:hypothetical protein